MYLMKTGKQKERELIIKLHQEKKTVREIASILGISKSKASFWVNRFKKTNSLEDKGRSGRPTPLSQKNLTDIKNNLKKKLFALQSKKAGISSKEVLELIENKINRKYSLRHTQRILHKIGLSLITPRVNHVRNDKVAQEKFRIEFKKNFDRNMWVIR